MKENLNRQNNRPVISSPSLQVFAAVTMPHRAPSHSWPS